MNEWFSGIEGAEPVSGWPIFQFAQSYSAINTLDWQYRRNADRSHYDSRKGNNPDGVEIQFAKEWQFNNLSNLELSILACKASGRKDAEIIEFSFLSS
ncbi:MULTISPECIES: hypothetical protein [unclassified Microcoleus]|uniref:hypothetical protein n=1 Tax=unclassified Microcoleus TaxID=2642155 RepID=UPI0025CFD87F|nr:MULTISPECIES: hypothetical protein [unclassified Microcoleus]